MAQEMMIINSEQEFPFQNGKLKTNYSLTNNIYVFNAEMIVVHKALEIIYDNPPQKLTILTDLLATIMALKITRCVILIVPK